MLDVKTKLKQNRPKITSVQSVSVASDINLAYRDSMEVFTLSIEIYTNRMNINLLISLEEMTEVLSLLFMMDMVMHNT